MTRQSLLGVVILWPLAARSATIVALPEPELARRSDAIVLGTVVTTSTAVNEQGQVLTVASLQVYKSIRGPGVGEVITLQVPGGRLPNGLVAHATGAPRLAAGQLLFGFLERHPRDFRPLGLAYGLLSVRKAQDGGYRVFRDVSGLAMLTPEGAPAPPDVYRLEDVPLDQLIARIEKHLGNAAPDGPRDPRAPGTVRP